MRQEFFDISIATPGKGLTDITAQVMQILRQSGLSDGLLTVFCRHTSCSLIVQENADPDVRADLEDFLSSLVPEDRARYRHGSEGLDDMPAHIRAALTLTSLSIPFKDARPVLGTWQGLYLFEHRSRPHQRAVAIHIIGS